MNGSKLQAFKLRIVRGRLTFISGTIYPTTGPIQYRRGGLALVGIPLVMGIAPSPAKQVLPKLKTIRAGIRAPLAVKKG